MTTSAYRSDIDGLRAVAVLSVVVNHLSAELLPGGYVGVDVFFVISGYLITGIISREMAEGGFSFLRFYERRTRRIFPALFMMMALTLIASYVILLPSDLIATLRGALGTLFFSSNIVFWRDLARGYFAATDASLNPLLHTWSLSVEEQFYLLFPVLLLLCYRYARNYTIHVLLLCALLSLASASLLLQSKSVAVFFLSPFRAWELLVGSLLALNTVPLLESRLVREATAFAGLLAVAISLVVYDSETAFPGFSAAVPVLGSAAIIYAGASGDSIVGRVLSLRPLTYLGLISFSLYLWHWPVIVLARYASGMEPLTHKLHWLFLASFLLASLSYHFVEQPFRRGLTLTRRQLFAAATAGTLGMTAWVAIGLVQGGQPHRFDDTVIQLDAARTPEIPFKDCSDRPLERACQLGSFDSSPSILVWGDSHALAWAPALDEVLAQGGMSARLATHSACPPLLGVSSKMRVACQLQNLDVESYLKANPAIRTVVLSAYWSTYFREGGPLAIEEAGTSKDGILAAAAALETTIPRLLSQGLNVVVIGPVPVYEQSVPLVLALEHATGSRWLTVGTTEQWSKHRTFFEIARNVKWEGANSFLFLDPIEWFCTPTCAVGKNEVSWYRDSHHLSVAGAQAMVSRLLPGLEFPGAQGRRSSIASDGAAR
jgi:peptidoglycan/LPS O-acetylase OafA/YrhL